MRQRVLFWIIDTAIALLNRLERNNPAERWNPWVFGKKNNIGR